ncbi:MAG TPA: hypothetical protein VLB73_04510 [Patescibacteria group bacterium]|nr:hypothetical protein [Patescibacteria group bacterium]
MHIPARVFGICVAFLVFLNIFVPAFAQQTTPATLAAPFGADVPQTVGTLSQGVLWGMVSFASCLISGIDVAAPSQKCLGYNGTTGKLGYVNSSGGLLGIESSAIAVLYSPPKFHVATYMSYLKNNFGLVKSSYAASPAGPSGFDQLTPIMNLWIAFRNIAYLLFVIVFVIVGFAIMLRAKIDPRTVMTIENQIPKIIVALILVSFSYAIAGLVIDIMWLTTYVTINLFSSLDPSLQAANMTQNISQNPLFFLQQAFTGGVLGLLLQTSGSIYDIMVPIVKQVIDGFGPLVILGIVPCLLQQLGSAVSNPIQTILSAGGNLVNGTSGTAINQCVTQGVTNLAAGLAGVVAFLIFAFALGFALFRMWFTLLKSYALFLIYAILGPFFIMLGVLPGTKLNFENWFRHLLAYSLVFPFAIGTILLGKTIADLYSNAKAAYVPPFIGVTQNTVSPIGPLIGFAVLLLLPQSLTMLQDALSAPDIKYLPGIGQLLAGGSQAYSSLVGQPWKRITRREDRMAGLSEGRLRTAVMNIGFGKNFNLRRLAGESEPQKH